MVNIFIGKSAAGKDTLMSQLVASGTSSPVVSYTTRPMREGEVNGREYVFVTRDEFTKLESDGKILESRSYDTLVNGNPDTWYYGSPVIDPEEKDWSAIVDIKGAKQYIEKYGTKNLNVIFGINCGVLNIDS